jgi:hypothetical protein
MHGFNHMEVKREVTGWNFLLMFLTRYELPMLSKLSNDHIHDPETSIDVECGTTCSSAGSRKTMVPRHDTGCLYGWPDLYVSP